MQQKNIKQGTTFAIPRKPLSGIWRFVTATADPRQKPSGERNRLGFTLIELLVVVLIIGILAAVALPQYQKAVWRSRNTQLKQLVKAVAQAEQTYFMANGRYATNFDELSIDLPLTAVTTPANGTYGTCDTNTRGTDAARQGKDFYIVLNTLDTEASWLHIVAYWDNNPYKCAGFSQTFNRLGLEELGLYCRELPPFVTEAGSFCEKVEKGTLSNLTQQTGWRFYSLP